jgi:hypothetical protein
MPAVTQIEAAPFFDRPYSGAKRRRFHRHARA